ncbi:MAG: hypothetical protein II574_03755 [Ruminococcus sp.]|nr:hypothetical protein [Ruminococcus sp.]
MKKLIKALILMTAAALMLFCGCGDEQTDVTNHERPILDLCTSLEHRDANAYLNCFTPAAKKAYLAGEGDSSDSSGKSKGKDIISRVMSENGLEDGDKISCEIIGKLELPSADREKLQKQYKSKYAKNVTIEKAFRIDASLTCSKGTDMHRFNVVLFDESWYIFGDVIEKFDF